MVKLYAGTADLNVPMFIALRRFTLLCTVILERSMLHKQHDRATMGAVGLMIGGTLNSMHLCHSHVTHTQVLYPETSCLRCAI